MPYSLTFAQPNLYTPFPPAYQYPAYGNPSLMSPLFLPDPQWQIGRESAAAAPVSQPVSGVDTGDLRTMAPVSQNLRTSYIPGIPGYANRQLIVMFRQDVPLQERSRILAMNNCAEIKTSPYSGITLVALPTFMSVKNTAEMFYSLRLS